MPQMARMVAKMAMAFARKDQLRFGIELRLPKPDERGIGLRLPGPDFASIALWDVSRWMPGRKITLPARWSLPTAEISLEHSLSLWLVRRLPHSMWLELQNKRAAASMKMKIRSG